jgi:fumarate hydratase, class II
VPGFHCAVPIEIIKAFGILKKCAAQVNMRYGIMPADIGSKICAAADEVSPMDARLLSTRFHRCVSSEQPMYM